MSEKERRARRKKRNIFPNIIGIVLIIFTIAGMMSVGTLAVSKLIGYEIKISQPYSNELAPKSYLFDSANNQLHILREVDNDQEFAEKVQKMLNDQRYEILDYGATFYQRSDGTWGVISECIYEYR